ncbi:MAG: hypothetical protein HY543_02860 [Deltaproteobacteria bacterium]|nr:hypothetical protein [Deltaproteobacteria bacterium]
MRRPPQWSLLFLLSALGPIASEARSINAPPPGNEQSIDLTQEIGKPATLHGVARDSKAGAIVVLAGDAVVYIDGLASWPAAFHGKNVVVHGLLKRRKYIPDPAERGDGAIAQGAKGLQDVLERARWTLEK